jgi:hypothetical protein
LITLMMPVLWEFISVPLDRYILQSNIYLVAKYL